MADIVNSLVRLSLVLLLLPEAYICSLDAYRIPLIEDRQECGPKAGGKSLRSRSPIRRESAAAATCNFLPDLTPKLSESSPNGKIDTSFYL